MVEELAADCEKVYNLAQDKYTEGKYQESVELQEITLQMNGCDVEISSNQRILMWEEGSTVNLGTIMIVDSVPEMHYISIQVGK